MAMLKTFLAFLVTGAFLGALIATLIAPSFLTWYNTPGGTTGPTLCDCPSIVRATADALVRGQIIGAILGGSLFFVFGIMFTRARSRRRKDSTSTPVTGGAP